MAKKVKRGPLYKRNGPKSRLPVFKPNPKVVAYYEQMSSPFIGLAERWNK